MRKPIPYASSFVRPLLALSGLMALSQGCMKPKSNVNCAGSKSVFKASSVGELPTGQAGYGGYLVMKTFSSPEESLKVGASPNEQTRCTVHLEFLKDNDLKARLWTARHCLRFDVTQSVMLEVYSQGIYHALPVQVAELESVKQIRLAQELPESLRIKYAELYKKLPSMGRSVPATKPTASVETTAVSATDATAARITDESGAPGAPAEVPDSQALAEQPNADATSQVFATFGDMEILEVKFSETLSQSQRDIIKSLHGDFFKQHDALKQTLTPDESGLLAEWVSAHEKVIALRALSGTAKLGLELNSCDEAALQPSEQCKQKPIILKVLGLTLLSPQLALLNDVTRAEAVSRDLAAALTARKSLWKKMQTLATKDPASVMVHSNFSLSRPNLSAPKGAAASEPVQSPQRFYVFSTPSLTREGNGKLFAEIRDQGFTYTQADSTVNVFFEPGDSGSLFSYKGFYPLAVVSTVGAHATSGDVVGTKANDVRRHAPSTRPYIDGCSAD